MSHTIALRLPEPLFKLVRQSAKATKKNRSEIIREALSAYFENSLFGEKDAYQSLMALMPLEKNNQPNLAINSKEILRKKIHARANNN